MGETSFRSEVSNRLNAPAMMSGVLSLRPANPGPQGVVFIEWEAGDVNSGAGYIWDGIATWIPFSAGGGGGGTGGPNNVTALFYGRENAAGTALGDGAIKDTASGSDANNELNIGFDLTSKLSYIIAAVAFSTDPDPLMCFFEMYRNQYNVSMFNNARGTTLQLIKLESSLGTNRIDINIGANGSFIQITNNTANRNVFLGDVGNFFNSTQLHIRDVEKLISMGDIDVVGNALMIAIDNVNRLIHLGDFNSNKNGTTIVLDDAARTVKMGDVNDVHLSTKLIIDDMARTVLIGDASSNTKGITILTDNSAGLGSMGDISGLQNGNGLLVWDGNHEIKLGSLFGGSEGMQIYLQTNIATRVITIGDAQGNFNNTNIILDDAAGSVKISAAGANTATFKDLGSNTSPLNLQGIPNFDSNLLAIAGGCISGDVYWTDDDAGGAFLKWVR